MSSPSQQELFYEAVAHEGALRQGEIITGLIQLMISLDSLGSERPVFSQVIHPYAIVVSQDCDLDWDYKSRTGVTQSQKILPNILFCQIVTAEELRGSGINGATWNNIKINKDERYQFLQRVAASGDAYKEGLPEMGIDFKRYFTIPSAEIYQRIVRKEVRRRCRLISPYVEHLCSRFYYFQSRVALPSEHFSEPNTPSH